MSETQTSSPGGWRRRWPLIKRILTYVFFVLVVGGLGTIEGLIAPIAPVLDQTLVALFDVLGLGIGEADLRLHGIDCRNAALVQ